MHMLLRNLAIAFAAGAGGGAMKYAAYKVALEFGILDWFKLPLAAHAFPGFLYKLVTLGGLFGFLLLLPLVARSWLIRGILVGVVATLADILFFQSGAPLAAALDFGQDVMATFESSPEPKRNWLDDLKRITPVALGTNIIWGLAASYIYDTIAER